MKQLYKEKSVGNFGTFELEINVGDTNCPNPHAPEIGNAVYKAADLLKDAVLSAKMAADPDEQKRSKANRLEILSLFRNRTIFVEEIPNGYVCDWRTRHLPWFVITTTLGRFTIGWRKRVISIDWKDTIGTKTAEELFPTENVTKEGKSIHAWTLENASRYINIVFTTATGQLSMPNFSGDDSVSDSLKAWLELHPD